ncbi:MAG: PocR ligand-binding domain-containing protein, partial [Thermodesulfobacteriota bacterium]|nr:PocR ligand-binding domain-containing protein [Thermodesulfobacteriota bacterium]
MEKLIPLQKLIDLDELQAMQNGFAGTVGTSSVIFSPEGVPLTRFTNPTRFCTLIQSTDEGKKRCFQCFMEMSRKALEVKEPKIIYCFAHGGHFVAPIIIDGVHKGTMFAGQFIPRKFSPEQLKDIEKLAGEINLDPGLLLEKARNMRVVAEDVVWNYSALLFHIVGVLAKLGAQKAGL